jgi:hypothetical protein
VAEFETKLRWLSERGDPVGAEELIERIEADLAGNPLVVVNKRREGTSMTKTQPPPTKQPSPSRGPAWAVAAFVAVLAVGALYLVFLGDGEPIADNPTRTTAGPNVETTTDLETIEAGVAAVYSGDAERAADLFELPVPDDDDWIRESAAYQAAIEGRLSLNCTEEDTPGEFSCRAIYHNALTDAIGLPVGQDSFGVVVTDGVITEFDFPEHTLLLAEIADFLHEQGYPACAREFFDLFPDEDAGPPTADCAGLMLEHLDEWASWYEANT